MIKGNKEKQGQIGNPGGTYQENGELINVGLKLKGGKDVADIFINGNIFMNKNNYTSTQNWKLMNDGSLINKYQNKCLFSDENSNVSLKSCDYKPTNLKDYYKKWKYTSYNQLQPQKSDLVLGLTKMF